MLKNTPANPTSAPLPSLLSLPSNHLPKMAPKIIIDLNVDSPPSSPTHPHHPNYHPSSSSRAASSYAAAAAMRNYPPRGRAGCPRSNYDYRRFIRTNQMKQQCLTGRPTPTTAGPSRLHYGSVHRYSAGTLNMQQGRQSHPVSDAWRTQKDHDRFVEGVSKCGTGNRTEMADWFVKNKSPQQIRKYPADYFTVTRPWLATRYIQKQPSSVGRSSDMNLMVNVAPRSRNPASRHLRRQLISKGLGGPHSSPRAKHMHESSGGSRLLRAPESALGQQLVPVSAAHVVSIPVFPAPSLVLSDSLPENVSLPSYSWRKPLHMFSRFLEEGPVLLHSDEVESSCSSSGSNGEAEDENGINLELTLG